MNVYILDNSWNEVLIFENNGYQAATGKKEANMFYYSNYNGGYSWTATQRTGYNIDFKLTTDGIPEEGDDTHYSMDEFLELYSFDNIDHF
mmetsp:Transcript_2705/g.4254  ORF Transcript_2705/g.4254 Transcript_2705/m.4254 type:complete len:90 (+) Transcript_2705:392-661(+)